MSFMSEVHPHQLWGPNSLRLRIFVNPTGVTAGVSFSSSPSRVLNGANSRVISRITGQSIREEATIGTRTFNLVKWIRARRLKWVVHILRIEDSRMLKQALQVIYDNRQEGDILMDVPKQKTWYELEELVKDILVWRGLVRTIRETNIDKWKRMSRLLIHKRKFS